jgi:hypothetical protein
MDERFKRLPWKYQFEDRPLTKGENVRLTLVLVLGVGVWVGLTVWLLR